MDPFDLLLQEKKLFFASAKKKEMVDPVGVWAYAQHSMRPDQFDDFQKMVDMFGVPAHKNEVTIARSRDKFDLWSLWEGLNPVLTEFINRDIVATGNWITQLYPRQEKEGMRGQLISYVFEPEVTPNVAEYAPNPVLEGHVESREYVMPYKGISFEMPVDFVFSPEGMKMFGEKCKQMEMSLDNALSYDVLETTFESGWNQLLRSLPQQPMTEQDFVRVRNEFNTYYAAFVKTAGGHNKLESKGVEILSDQGIRPTLSIDPSSSSIGTVNRTDRTRNVAAVGGEEGIKQRGIDSDSHVLISSATEYPIEMHASRAFKKRGAPKNSHNPAFQRRTHGEFAFAGDLTTSESLQSLSEYRTGHRSITLVSAEGGRRVFTLSEMIDASGLFGRDGHLSAPHGKNLAEILCTYKPNVKLSAKRPGWGASDDCDIPLFGKGKGTKRSRAAAAGESLSLGEAKAEGESYTLHALYKNVGWLEQITDYLNSCKAKVEKEPKAVGTIDELLALLNPPKGEEDEVTFTRQNLQKLMAHNIPIPINFLFFRPWITLDVGSYILMRHGADTGVLFTNRAAVHFGRNVKQRTIGLHLNFAAKTVISTEGERNIVLFPDAFPNRYIGGYDTEVNPPDAHGGYEESLLRNNDVKSITIVAIPGNQKITKTYLDLTGFVNSGMVQQRDTSPDPMYATALVYSSMYGWPAQGVNILTHAHFTRQQILDNTLMDRGYYKIHTPAHLKLGDNDQNEILGHGRFPARVTPKTMRVLMGEEDNLEEPKTLLS
jgi:hypothetical protein